jgi:multidrug efflux pump
MLGVTLFGLFLTPVFYVTLRKLSGKNLAVAGSHSSMEGDSCVLETNHV